MLHRHPLDGDHRAPVFVVDPHQLRHDRVMTSIHDVIGKEDCKGLMSDKRFCQKDRVAETEGVGLPHVRHACHGSDPTDHRQIGLIAFTLKHVFELTACVEVILHGPLACRGDHDDLRDSRGDGLFNPILDDRSVYNGEHFLRDRLRGRKHARAETCRWKDCRSDWPERAGSGG